MKASDDQLRRLFDIAMIAGSYYCLECGVKWASSVRTKGWWICPNRCNVKKPEVRHDGKK